MTREDSAAQMRAAELRVAEVIGSLIEFWGFKAAMGRLWTILYLSPEPLGAAELGDRLSMSAGSVSMSLAELQKWGVVKKTWKPGERRDFYEAETSIWKLVTRVFRERELGFVREAIAAFEAALKLVVNAAKSAASDEKKRLRFVEGRLEALLALSRLGESLIGMLVSGAPIDPKPLKSMFTPGDDD